MVKIEYQNDQWWESGKLWVVKIISLLNDMHVFNHFISIIYIPIFHLLFYFVSQFILNSSSFTSMYFICFHNFIFNNLLYLFSLFFSTFMYHMALIFLILILDTYFSSFRVNFVSSTIIIFKIFIITIWQKQS